jgi:hypothetical protein
MRLCESALGHYPNKCAQPTVERIDAFEQRLDVVHRTQLTRANLCRYA